MVDGYRDEWQRQRPSYCPCNRWQQQDRSGGREPQPRPNRAATEVVPPPMKDDGRTDCDDDDDEPPDDFETDEDDRVERRRVQRRRAVVHRIQRVPGNQNCA